MKCEVECEVWSVKSEVCGVCGVCGAREWSVKCGV